MFDARDMHKLAPGEHITTEGCPDLRVQATTRAAHGSIATATQPTESYGKSCWRTAFNLLCQEVGTQLKQVVTFNGAGMGNWAKKPGRQVASENAI